MRYFIVKSDQHVIEAGQKLYGIDTNKNAGLLVEQILRETVPVEVLVNLGDAADSAYEPNRFLALASAESYQQAGRIFAPVLNKTLQIPGNHDNPELIYRLLGDNWSSRKNACCVFQFGAITFIGVDLRTGPEATGYLRPDTGAELDRLLQDSRQAIIFTHFPWYPTDNEWVDGSGRVTNGEVFGAVLVRNQAKILAVFHGHLHTWWSGTYAGIPHYSLAGSAVGFRMSPKETQTEQPCLGPLGYLLVGVRADGSLLVRPRFLES